jgi:hypothetical protein
MCEHVKGGYQMVPWYQVGSVWYRDVDGYLLAVVLFNHVFSYAVMKVDSGDVLGCVDSGTVGTLSEGMQKCEELIG